MYFWQNIPFVRLRYCYECREPLRLPRFKGSAWRGAFGHALKRVACALRQSKCDDCLLRYTCVYTYVFETPPPPDSRRLRLYPTAPHPFILRPPRETREYYQARERLTGELILIGQAIGYLPYFVYALEIMGENGLGRGRGRLRLVDLQELGRSGLEGCNIYSSTAKTLSPTTSRAHQETLAAIAELPQEAGELSLNLLTPLRIKFDGSYVEKMEFHHLIRNLLRRLASLAYFHCQIDPEADGFYFKGCIQAAETVKLSWRRCQWQDWERYSQRQQTKMLLGGIVGNISFREVPPQFLPLLLLGEQLHVGKTASFGLGQYKITNFSIISEDLCQAMAAS
jgi:hypothetical protein